MLALPQGDDRSVIPQLLRDAIQKDLNVDVTGDDAAGIIVRSR